MFLTQSGGFIIKPISSLLGAILSLLSRGLNAIGVESIGIAIILFTDRLVYWTLNLNIF